MKEGKRGRRTMPGSHNGVKLRLRDQVNSKLVF